MRKTQRVEALYNLLERAGTQSVADLADAVGATEATIRRDLKVLVDQNRVSRSYGAARINSNDGSSESETFTDDQRALARTATDLIQTGDMIILHGGAVNRIIAAELARGPRITVITNSPRILDIVVKHRDIDAISIGGLYSHAGSCLYGHLAESSLNELRADMVFFEPSGIDFKRGFTHSNVVEIPILKLMSRTARSVVLTVCADAFDNATGALVESLETVSTIIADTTRISEHYLTLLRESGIRTECAGHREGE